MKFLNPKVWIEGVIMRKVFVRVAKVAAAAILGILTPEILKQFGVTIDAKGLEDGLVVAITAGAIGLENWAKHRFAKRSEMATIPATPGTTK